MCNCQACQDLRHLADCGVSEDFVDRYCNESLDAGIIKQCLTARGRRV